MRLLILCLALLAIACSAEPRQNAAWSDGAPTETGDPGAENAPANAATPVPPVGQAQPADATSSQAAATVLRRYFALIDTGRQAEAAGLWRDEEQAAAFAAELRKFGKFRPSIAAPGRVEGAAGSLYVEISLQLLRDSRSGVDALSDGSAVLRRVNDVPGSTAEQRRWRIERVTLQRPPEPIGDASLETSR